jgi:hypothetical protein
MYGAVGVALEPDREGVTHRIGRELRGCIRITEGNGLRRPETLTGPAEDGLYYAARRAAVFP